MAEERSENNLDSLRTSVSYILAQAVVKLYPDAKLATGSNTDTGFYYDFEVAKPFSQDDLSIITNEMKKIIKAKHEFEHFTLSPKEALSLMKDQPYILEVIQEAANNKEIAFWKHEEFVDVSTNSCEISIQQTLTFALLSTSGAYWRGSSSNAMLSRIYGTAFETKEELKSYLTQLETAQKRDHNKIGRELEYFTITDIIGQGLPILMPNGAKVIQLLQRFVEDEEERRGYLLTKTPFFAKSDLYKISGHWQHYRDSMFIIGDADNEQGEEVFALRPMTCPFQFQVYLNQSRSYRDLPLRYAETSTLFRNETSGEMHGLIRVRQFTISEGHLIVRPDQLEDEFKNCLELAIYMLKTLGLYEDVSYRFSKWDENDRSKYIGDKEQWESAQETMRVILDRIGLEYEEGNGEAAFYGPKLDIQIKNVFGKEDTLITIQIDFQLAQKFNMMYMDSDGTKKYPYVIHRTSIGCYERTLALLLEKYVGALPLWLSPEQIRILPITDRVNEYGRMLKNKLERKGFRTTLHTQNETIGRKIRAAQSKKIPYMLIVGDKELETGTVSVRARDRGNLGMMDFDEFSAIVLKEVEEKAI